MTYQSTKSARAFTQVTNCKYILNKTKHIQSIPSEKYFCMSQLSHVEQCTDSRGYREIGNMTCAYEKCPLKLHNNTRVSLCR